MDNLLQSINIIERLINSTDGLEPNQDSFQGSISNDGRYVVFASEADNLVAEDNNNFADIFVYDRNNKTTEIVSISTEGIQGNSFSKEPVISDDGRYIFFVSESDNLVAEDTNKSTDIFVHDRNSKTTERISLNSNNVEAESYSFTPKISADLRYVAFESEADNLVAEDSNNNTDIFIRDRNNNSTAAISISTAGVLGNKRSKSPNMTRDGRYIVFESDADNLVAEDSNSNTDIFIRDRNNNSTEIISVSSAGEAGDGYSFNSSISDDGRYVVFESRATNLVDNDTNSKVDVFLRDRVSQTTTKISMTENGSEANNDSIKPVISGNGRYVVFESKASNLVADDNNNLADLFKHDLVTKTITRINLSSEGIEANNKSYGATISDTGEYIVFDSQASNLALVDNNNAKDIFISTDANLIEHQDLNNFKTKAVHRFYETVLGNHFYTTGDREIELLKSQSAAGEINYQYENAAFTVLENDLDAITGEPIAAAKPVYRFFNGQTGAHFYTMDETEKSVLESNNYGYSFEGIEYYAFESQPENVDTVPLYRMFNQDTGAHLFTVDNSELNYHQNNSPQFILEDNGAAAFYVFEL